MATRGRRLAQGDANQVSAAAAVPRSRPSGVSTVPLAPSAGPAVPSSRGVLMSGDGALTVIGASQSAGNGSSAALAALRSKLR